MFGRIMILLLVAGFLIGVYARPSGGAGPEQQYVVRVTDTLWSIAASHYAGDPREAIWKLEQRNRLTGTTVVPGQRLVLP